jgi:hypothetical protein
MASDATEVKCRQTLRMYMIISRQNIAVANRNLAAILKRNPRSDKKAVLPSNLKFSEKGSLAIPQVGLWLILLLIYLTIPVTTKGEIQLDVIYGYGDRTAGFVREGNWFPVTCEVVNDGPSFNATIEIEPSSNSENQRQTIQAELPTNTRKRFVVPAFAASGDFFNWTVRLRDAKGKQIVETTGGFRSGAYSKIINQHTKLLGVVANTRPTLPELKGDRADFTPQVARIPVEYLPDNPIALEGLSALYLHSEKAPELSDAQIAALLSWLKGGGRLIMAVENPADVGSALWMRKLLPMRYFSVRALKLNAAFSSWLRTIGTSPPRPNPNEASFNHQALAKKYGFRTYSDHERRSSHFYGVLRSDTEFSNSEMTVAIGTLRDGDVLLMEQENPLIVAAKRGRGEIITLNFSPRREPFKSWQNSKYFWAKLIDLPDEMLFGTRYSNPYVQSIDGAFGAMIDSRQVKKLPVSWLLLLLVAYLLVIGPLDQYWLKKINRQMLTWLTFPAYVALFSLLIYYIGYKLRAGETEWNELHLVDIVDHSAETELRGRTYASLYSPINSFYPLTSSQAYATFRGESNVRDSKTKITYLDNGFEAQVFVPVWTSQLFVHNWIKPSDPPLNATFENQGASLRISITNNLNRPLESLKLVYNNQIHNLGKIPAKDVLVKNLNSTNKESLQSYVRRYGGNFFNDIDNRGRALGRNRRSGLKDLPNCSLAASFASLIPNQGSNKNFENPQGLDLTPLINRGDAILLAWDAGNSLADPIIQFKPRRSSQNTLLRMLVPLEPSAD